MSVRRFAVTVSALLTVLLVWSGLFAFYKDCNWYSETCLPQLHGVAVNWSLVTNFTTGPSMSLDIDERAKWQQEQVAQYCKENPMTRVLPNNPPRDNHLIYDDHRKLVFCYVPKAGCTPVKRVIFLLQKKIPKNLTDIRKLNLLLERAVWSSSFASKTMINATKRNETLMNYFKFTVLRNPLERLLSGFLDKVAPQMDFILVRKNHWPDSLRASILQTYRPKDYKRWYSSNGTMNLKVTFREYIWWYVSSSKYRLNEHFVPFVYLAKPCLIKYDFYITFKLYDSDMLELIKRFEGTPDMLWTVGHNRKDSNVHMEAYYGSLSADMRKQLYIVMEEDLEFYHQLQPEDKVFNEQLLFGS